METGRKIMSKAAVSIKARLDPGIFLVTLLCLTPIVATVIWTIFPSISSAVAIAKLSGHQFELAATAGDLEAQTIKRQIQRHFLDYSVYIPTEDIVIFQDGESKNTRLETLMTKACGRGSMFVWVPFKIALPFYGEKVIEWCWKPKLQVQK
jgi:hypothetical protein